MAKKLSYEIRLVTKILKQFAELGISPKDGINLIADTTKRKPEILKKSKRRKK